MKIDYPKLIQEFAEFPTAEYFTSINNIVHDPAAIVDTEIGHLTDVTFLLAQMMNITEIYRHRKIATQHS